MSNLAHELKMDEKGTGVELVSRGYVNGKPCQRTCWWKAMPDPAEFMAQQKIHETEFEKFKRSEGD